MENMELYTKFRACPPEAQKPITAGRLKGKTDINPMWRLKVLTEQFGPCGIGWVYKIVRTWIDDGNGAEKIANVEIELKIRYCGEWSEPIPGIGGAMFVENESKGIHTCDECYKKALTDAISVACKALGIAADIYFAKDPDSKYPTGDQSGDTKPLDPVHSQPQPLLPQLTYKQALDLMLTTGPYQGQTLSQIYKTDIEYINELSRSPVTDTLVLQAISIINAEIVRFREKNQTAAQGG
jgi:hypothetical protein